MLSVRGGKSGQHSASYPVKAGVSCPDLYRDEITESATENKLPEEVLVLTEDYPPTLKLRRVKVKR